ncbi:GntR family transcriptional regulator [Halalkalibacter oceani]|uniref:GntR family transcriptional regulator n=1 Tax=Halalkalibacter oceani TaxID=1653776 RepID=A0A9X2ISB8_9BACI|nr:GntR family transcriptional regulator [Halalkalibacter oceani]MCM3716378.1 GntR family transcriptional regulator [Halalkalibacter oceani]
MKKVVSQLAKDRIAAILREEILSRNLKPGQKLLEKELCEKLGVSRTPLREAIRNLEVEGLVESIPNRGSRVKVMTTKDVVNLFELRIELEAMATRKSVPHLTEADIEGLHAIQQELLEATARSSWSEVDALNKKFHSLLRCKGENDRLLSIIDQLYQVGGIIRVSTFSIPGRALKALEEHVDILEAVAARDAERAGQLMYDHLTVARDTLLKHLEDLQFSE